LNIHEILEYYAICCLAFFPVSLGIVIYIYKKTNFFIKMDEYIDRRLGFKDKSEGLEEKKEERLLEAKAEKKKEENKEDEFNEWEENEKNGTPCLRLKVGDIYKCILSKSEANEVGATMTWSLEKKFIGEIKEIGGLFEARRVGSSLVICKNKPYYFIEVISRNEKWFASETIKDIVSGNPTDMIKNRLLGKQLLDTNFSKRTFSYQDPFKEVKSLICQGDEEGNLVRAVFIMNNTEGLKNSIKKEMTERMIPIKELQEDKTYWVHEYTYMRDQCVDFVALMKESHNGDLLLCIGKTWRIAGMRDEIETNLEMTDRSFVDCLDTEDIPDMVGIDLKEKEKEKDSPSFTEREQEPVKTQEIPYTKTTDNPIEEKEEPTFIPSDDDMPKVEETSNREENGPSNDEEESDMDLENGPDMNSISEEYMTQLNKEMMEDGPKEKPSDEDKLQKSIQNDTMSNDKENMEKSSDDPFDDYNEQGETDNNN
jgi:hypothetical protein